MINEYKILNDPEYREQWVKDELRASSEYFLEQLGIKDKYICDCEKNYGVVCSQTHPEKYRDGGCK